MKQYRHKETYNCKLSAILALFSKKSNDLHIINDLVGYEMQWSSHHGTLLSVIQEKILIAKSIKTSSKMLDYKLIVAVRQFR